MQEQKDLQTAELEATQAEKPIIISSTHAEMFLSSIGEISQGQQLVLLAKTEPDRFADLAKKYHLQKNEDQIEMALTPEDIEQQLNAGTFGETIKQVFDPERSKTSVQFLDMLTQQLGHTFPENELYLTGRLTEAIRTTGGVTEKQRSQLESRKKGLNTVLDKMDRFEPALQIISEAIARLRMRSDLRDEASLSRLDRASLQFSGALARFELDREKIAQALELIAAAEQVPPVEA